MSTSAANSIFGHGFGSYRAINQDSRRKTWLILLIVAHRAQSSLYREGPVFTPEGGFHHNETKYKPRPAFFHGGDFIVRPSKPAHERKQAVTISLSPSDLVILDNLATHLKTHRSGVISQMLVAKGWKDLGLKAAEKREHTAPVQNWPNEWAAKKRGIVFDRDAPRACNPAHMDGKCSHHDCQIVYRKYGVL